MDRSDGTIIPPKTWWLTDKDIQAACRVLTSAGGAVFFVGGCVRDALLGRDGADIDLSTDVDPHEVMRLMEAAGLKVVPTGVDHGTVTVVSGAKPVEITTFRKDVETDGRRAVVAYSKDIFEDARRRDFTLNALYVTPAGQLVDPLGGLDDCLTRRIRFIEDAETRITEDYLRVLRYFRFHAWYADDDHGFDADALHAISSNIDGLGTLSAERVGGEMIRLLRAPNPARAIAAMRQTGVLLSVLPGSDDKLLGPAVHFEDLLSLAPDPMLRLAALGGEDVTQRLRLSRKNADVLADMVREAWGAAPLHEISYRYGIRVANAALILRATLAQSVPTPRDIAEIHAAASQAFPLAAGDLMHKFTGKSLGDKLKEMEKTWIASNFGLDRQALIALALSQTDM